MKTECNATQLTFQGLGRRRVEAEFGAGLVTTDAGALLIREVATSTRMIKRIAACFTDGRDPSQVEHLLPARLRPSNIDASAGTVE